MGLLDRLRGAPAPEPWTPPVLGACACPDHVESLAQQQVGSDPSVTIGSLDAAGVVTVTVAREAYLFAEPTGQRRGPFHWTVTYINVVSDLYDEGAPAAFDDMVFIQPGIENLFRIDAYTLAVGAPELCQDGVVAAVLKALANDRVRLPAE